MRPFLRSGRATLWGELFQRRSEGWRRVDPHAPRTPSVPELHNTGGLACNLAGMRGAREWSWMQRRRRRRRGKRYFVCPAVLLLPGACERGRQSDRTIVVAMCFQKTWAAYRTIGSRLVLFGCALSCLWVWLLLLGLDRGVELHVKVQRGGMDGRVGV